MQRPTRTRRLSITAIVSLLAFVVVTGAGVRSFWTMDELDFAHDRAVALNGGCFYYAHASFPMTPKAIDHLSTKYQVIPTARCILGFGTWNRVMPGPMGGKVFYASTPIWPFVLLLLIAPVRWLIGRPASRSAFAVITSD